MMIIGNLPAVTNLGRILKRQQNFGSRVCMEDERNSYSYTQLLEEIAAWQSRFDALNVVPSTVVAVRADYSLSAIAALLAVPARGAIVALIPQHAEATGYLVDAQVSEMLDVHHDGSHI